MGSRAVRLAAAVGSLAAASVAAAAPAIVVGEIQGDRGGALRDSLVRAFCETYACIPVERVETDGKIDLRRFAREGVSATLLGSVAGQPPERRLWLLLLVASDRPAPSWTLLLDASGQLSPAQIGRLRGALAAELAASGAGGAARATPQAQGRALGRVPPPAVPLHPPGEPPPPPHPAAAPGPGRAGLAQTPSAVAGRTQHVVAAEVGPFLANRSLSYTSASSGLTPHGYDLYLVSGPWIGLEVFPLAFSTDGPASGLGLAASFGTSTGFTSTSPDGEPISTTMWWLRVGIEWRIHPVQGSRLAVVPGVAYSRRSFELDPAYPGLPNSNLAGIEGSLHLDVPLTRWLGLLAGAGYTYWFEAPDLVGTYFPEGSAWGLAGEAGLDVRVWGSLSLRGMVVYDVTSYVLTPTELYPVSAASDRSLCARFTLRGRY